MDTPLHERLNKILKIWEKACGSQVTVSEETYQAERISSAADRNYCLGYMMREAKAFPKESNMFEALELYFQSCCIESNVVKYLEF